MNQESENKCPICHKKIEKNYRTYCSKTCVAYGLAYLKIKAQIKKHDILFNWTGNIEKDYITAIDVIRSFKKTSDLYIRRICKKEYELIDGDKIIAVGSFEEMQDQFEKNGGKIERHSQYNWYGIDKDMSSWLPDYELHLPIRTINNFKFYFWTYGTREKKRRWSLLTAATLTR